MNWTIPRWDGQTAAVLGSGESMSREVADSVRGLRVLVVNNTHELAPWADVLYAADALWWAQYHQKTSGFRGTKVSVEDTRFKDVLTLKNGGKTGFDPDRSTIRTGGNGGYACVHIAAHAGCKRILLCGFDMRPGHWHGVHRSPLREPGAGTMAGWIENFRTLASELAKRGIEVLNCTPESALPWFPMAHLGRELEKHAARPVHDSAAVALPA